MSAKGAKPPNEDHLVRQTRLPTTSFLSEIIDGAIDAVNDEIVASARDPSDSIVVRGGRWLGLTGELDLWTFETDDELSAAPETPAWLELPGVDPVACVIVASGDLDVVLGTREAVDGDPSSARLRIDPTFILRALTDRLVEAEITSDSERLLSTILDLNDAADGSVPHRPIDEETPGLSAEQRSVVARSSRDGVQFVWGPPGTGKTSTLAALVERLVDDGERVLVLAHANAAVDVAMVRVADRMRDHPALQDGAVLRAGEARLIEARSNPWINPDSVLRREVPALVEAYEQLVERRSELSRRARDAAGDDRSTVLRDLEQVREEASAAYARLTEARQQLIAEARVVGTTLSRFVLSDLLWNWEPDVIIIDEASMATNPFVLAAALRSPRTLALFGDFRQLPPVVRASTPGAEQWLSQDVFSLAQVTARVEAGRPDQRLSFLQTQFRMGAEISQIVSRFAYFNMLRNDAGVDERAVVASARLPAEGAQLVIVDISDWAAPCLTDACAGSFSRFNLPSALLSVSAAVAAAASGVPEVGVIAAYRAQARLIADLLRGEEGLAAATTHRFQGAESDAIVLDLVDSDPQPGPSMLTGGDPALTRRLVNVAISRARGKLVLIVDLDFVARFHPPASPIAELLRLLRGRDTAMLRPDDVTFPLGGGPVEWHPSWSDGLVAALHQAPLKLDVALGDRTQLTPAVIDAIRSAAAGGTQVTCRVPASAVAELEALDIEIKLKTIGAGPVALLRGVEASGDALVIGGCRPVAPAGVITSQHAISTAWKLLTGRVTN